MDNKIEWQITEVQKGTGRTVKVHGMRVSRVRLDKTLTPAMRDAASEISHAYELLSKGWGYALIGLKMPSMGTRGGEMSQEKIDAIRKKLGALHVWEFDTNPAWVKAVRAIEEMGLTVNDYAGRIEKHPSTISDWYRKGLNEWCVRQGWGDQI